MPKVQVPSGEVEATHRHPVFGYCVVTRTIGRDAEIRTNNGTAWVTRQSITPLALMRGVR